MMLLPEAPGMRIARPTIFAPAAAVLWSAFVLFACFPSPANADSDGTWSQISTTGKAPLGGEMDAAVYDSARDRFIIGGQRIFMISLGSQSHQALPLSGPATWEPLPLVPYDRSGTIYDPVRDRLVSFGGDDPSGPLQELRYLPLDPLGTWHLLPADGTAPSQRTSPAVAYDSSRDRMLVYGGDGENDLWELTLAGTPTWNALASTGTPPPPGSRSAVYDPVGDRLIVYAGTPDASQGNLAWSLDLAGTPAWTLYLPVGFWPSTGYACTAYDSRRDRLLVFGYTNSGPGLWALSLTGTPTWTTLTPAGPSPADIPPYVALYDAPRDRLVIQASTYPDGFGSTETWALDFGEPLAVGSPSSVALAVAGPNPTRGALRFDVTLPEAGTAMLEVFDAAGRRVATRAVDGPGRVTVAFDGAGRVAPGVYVARLSFAGREVTTRAAVIR